jgi:Protein of unknown function (DUF664)
MRGAELLVDAFGRIREDVGAAVDGLSDAELGYRPDPDVNSIAWLIWHLTRIEDDHVADVAGTAQAWTDDSWAERFALPFPATATGYGHRPADVERVRVGADLLVGYYEAVHRRTVEYLSRLDDVDFDRIVDERWDPPVTLGVRIVSVVSDALQHAGQAAFLRGMVLRRRD